MGYTTDRLQVYRRCYTAFDQSRHQSQHTFSAIRSLSLHVRWRHQKFSFGEAIPPRGLGDGSLPTERCSQPKKTKSREAEAVCGHCLQGVWYDFQETFSRKFSRICSFIDIYRAGSLTPGITLIPFTQAIAQLKNIYRGLIAPISINPGLLQDVFTGTL